MGETTAVGSETATGCARYPLAKWFLDKAFASALLALFAPVFVLIFLAMAGNMLLRKADRGSWIYREPRISEGRPFDILKFRVLKADVIARMPPDNRHSRPLEQQLDNLTWAGRFVLKKWYFDELPQLWNVLSGDMSLVGPRPWPLELYADQVRRGVLYRNQVRAGWTGPAQLQKRKNRAGTGAVKSTEKLDMEYVWRCNNWPGWKVAAYDLGVLGETLKVMVESQGLRN